MKRLIAALFCLLIPYASFAANEYAVAKRAEGSMLVTGSIVVNPDGSVNSYTLDQPDKLPAAVAEVISKTVPAWKFQPILMLDANNKPELAKAAMSLRVVAHPLNDSNYALGVAGVSFGKETVSSSDAIGYKENRPPHYSRDAIADGISGIVYLVLKVGIDGHVEDVKAEQVNLRVAGSDAQMEAWRRELSLPAIAAAQEWTFNVPQSAEYQQMENRVVRVPVNFTLEYPGARSHDEYGQWDAYVPGPVNQISWANPEKRAANNNADAIPNNGLVFQDDQRFVLLNPPDKG